MNASLKIPWNTHETKNPIDSVPKKEKRPENIFTHIAYVQPYEYNNMCKPKDMIWHISIQNKNCKSVLDTLMRFQKGKHPFTTRNHWNLGPGYRSEICSVNCYGMVWCSIVWYGVVLCGMWYSKMWYGVLWYSVLWCGMVLYVLVWCHVV